MISKVSTLIMAIVLLPQIILAQYTKLFDFEYTTTGAYPEHTALITDGTWLYGVTGNGGANNHGVIYKIKPDGTDYQKIFDFNYDTSGAAPKGSLIAVGDYLYGTTWVGCAYSRGGVFRIRPDGTDFSLVAEFEGPNGQTPIGSFYFDGTYLYGTTTQGGENLAGTIYRILPAATAEIEVIFSFDIGYTTGYNPHSTLVSDGTYLYGTTPEGGAENAGVVFKISPDGTGFTTLHDFENTPPDGALPYGGLLYDGSEYLYGMASLGGANNDGTIYRIKTDGSEYEIIVDFDGTNGGAPFGVLIMQGSTMYGMTLGAGTDLKGNMFSVETDGSNLTTLVDFEGDNGSIPFGSLLYTNGAFFGVTTEGGATNHGVIFRYGDILESVDEISIPGLQIYPNPAVENITVLLPQSSNTYHVEIVNTAGHIVWSENLPGGGQNINVSHLPAGVYLMLAKEDEKTYSGIMVIE